MMHVSAESMYDGVIDDMCLVEYECAHVQEQPGSNPVDGPLPSMDIQEIEGKAQDAGSIDNIVNSTATDSAIPTEPLSRVYHDSALWHVKSS